MATVNGVSSHGGGLLNKRRVVREQLPMRPTRLNAAYSGLDRTSPSFSNGKRRHLELRIRAFAFERVTFYFLLGPQVRSDPAWHSRKDPPESKGSRESLPKEPGLRPSLFSLQSRHNPTLTNLHRRGTKLSDVNVGSEPVPGTFFFGRQFWP